MDVFGYGTEEGTRPLLPPGTCWICENSPQQEAEKVIDTRRNSRAGGVSHALSERKYVCGGCAAELGQAVGQISQADYTALVTDLRKAEDSEVYLAQKLKEAEANQTRVVNADEIADVVSQTVRAELAKSVKKAPARAKVSPAVTISVPPTE